MKKALSLILTLLLTLFLGACTENITSEQNSSTPIGTSEEITVTANPPAQTASPSEPDSSVQTASPSEPAPSQEETLPTEDEEGGKILIAYFSATGTTKKIAEQLAEVTGADLFEIVPEEPYSSEDLNYNDDDCRANQEQSDETSRPAIVGRIENMDSYEVVLIGHPIWWGKEPRIIDTFMESYDFSGKTMVNFCTSGGSGVSTSTSNLKAFAPNANWLDGHRFNANASLNDIQAWFDSLNIELP
ncbi:MAG: flavodoxin [Clostridia bacterium]|nr:flavodoxin [Clostridia bacterium]